MTGVLKRYKHDPNRKNRGAGLYYHRGKGVFSKYKVSRDRKIKAHHRISKQIRKRYAHTGDVRTWY